MADIKSKYGTEAQAISITLGTGLASTEARSSAVVDNTTDLFIDALVQVVIKTPSGTANANATCEVYAYGLVDYTTTPTYPEAVVASDSLARIDGTDKEVVLTSPTNLVRIGVVSTPISATYTYTYPSNPMSVAAAFGGVLPAKWGIVVVNKTGVALADGGSAQYQGVYLQA